VTVVTMAALTLREALRRKVVWALLALTVVLLALDGWGFASMPGMETSYGSMTSGQARLLASEMLNLVMFAMSLIVALGTRSWPVRPYPESSSPASPSPSWRGR
jgi:hypothetical protein